jgi:murein DD-endopeptidase MepM/ murein hydrolase activator NlpD
MALGPAGLAALLGCGGDGSPAGSSAAAPPASVEASAPAGAPTPPAEPGAFELPGLRERAPAPRFGWPTESVHVTSTFGWRVDPVSGVGTRLHRGIDLRGTPGDLVLSIGAGTVAFVGHDPLLGNLVIVDHGEGLESFYGHLSDVLVAADVEVDRGAAIGLVGNTGRSEAPHLHLTVRLDGVAIDPLEIIGEPLHRPEALIGGVDRGPGPSTDPSAIPPADLEPPSPPAPDDGAPPGLAAGKGTP